MLATQLSFSKGSPMIARALLALGLMVTAAAAQTPDYNRYPSPTLRTLYMRGSGTPQTIDLRSSPPDNGVFFGGGGNEISFCPWLGCSKNYDINVAAGWVRTKTTRGIDHAETGLALDQFVTSGFAQKWKPSTTYAVGDRVTNTVDRYLYEATVAGTSAASGGPTVVGTPADGDAVGSPGGTQPTQIDGTVTWKYLQDADFTDAKTTFNVTTFAGVNAGHTWSSAINTHLGEGAQTDLAVTQELDFFNDAGDCQATGKNCFLNLWFVQGPYTSTSFIQASGGGNSPTLATDNSSGGAVQTGISFVGANTIRGVAFSDGTNSSSTLKGYPGTRHVSGFINDESTGPTSYRTSGQYSYATWNDVATTPYALRLEGTYSGAAVQHKDFLLGKWGGDPSYAAMTFNNTLAVGALTGWFGKAGDSALYGNVPTGGSYRLRVGNTDTVQIGGNGVNVNGSYQSNGVVGVSCAAGSVNSATMVVTNGIVTHC